MVSKEKALFGHSLSENPSTRKGITQRACNSSMTLRLGREATSFCLPCLLRALAFRLCCLTAPPGEECSLIMYISREEGEEKGQSAYTCLPSWAGLGVHTCIFSAHMPPSLPSEKHASLSIYLPGELTYFDMKLKKRKRTFHFLWWERREAHSPPTSPQAWACLQWKNGGGERRDPPIQHACPLAFPIIPDGLNLHAFFHAFLTMPVCICPAASPHDRQTLHT